MHSLPIYVSSCLHGKCMLCTLQGRSRQCGHAVMTAPSFGQFRPKEQKIIFFSRESFTYVRIRPHHFWIRDLDRTIFEYPTTPLVFIIELSQFIFVIISVHNFVFLHIDWIVHKSWHSWILTFARAKRFQSKFLNIFGLKAHEKSEQMTNHWVYIMKFVWSKIETTK